MKKNYYLLTGFLVAAAVLSNTNVFADAASQIESDNPGSTVTYDAASGQYPVVTAMLSSVGTYGGHYYSSWSFLANDGTGSIDIYAYSTTLTAGAGPAYYSPTVGDAISLTGTYSPYNQIPEIGTSTTPSQPTIPVYLQSTGNLGLVPAPTLVTIPQVNVGLLPLNLAGYLLQLDNVVIGGNLAGGTYNNFFPTYAQGHAAGGVNAETYSVNDGSGNSMTLFDWTTSYSVDGAMGGNAVPPGPVDIVGFMDIYTPTSGNETPQPEFVPTEIIGVPEPSVLNLLGVGGASSLLALISRFRKKV
jgi:hypothetical protein